MSLHATSAFVWILLILGAVFALLLVAGAAVGLWALLRRLSGRGGFRGVSASAVHSPTEIMAALDAIPPLERPRAAKAYRGMPVRWRVCYDTAFSSGLTTVRLMSTEWGTSYPWLFCDFSRRRYPQLRRLPKSAPLWISGRIKGIRLNDIYLENVSLGFEE